MFSTQSEMARVNTLLIKEKENTKGIEIDSLVWSLSEEGPWASFNRALTYAGISRRGRSHLLLRICLWISLTLLLATITNRLSLLILAPLLIFFEVSWIKGNISKRRKGFELDYSALLLSLASSIKTGADPIFAMSQAVNLFPTDSFMWKEVSLFRNNIERGVGEDKSLNLFAITINYPDLELFRVAMILARREGSSLGECLQRLAKVTRQRQSFSRKVKSAIAMQKMAATGIAACAIVIGIIQYLSSPEAISHAWNHPLGNKILVAGISLLAFGLIWMRKISSRTM